MGRKVVLFPCRRVPAGHFRLRFSLFPPRRGAPSGMFRRKESASRRQASFLLSSFLGGEKGNVVAFFLSRRHRCWRCPFFLPSFLARIRAYPSFSDARHAFCIIRGKRWFSSRRPARRLAVFHGILTEKVLSEHPAAAASAGSGKGGADARRPRVVTMSEETGQHLGRHHEQAHHSDV